MHLVGKIETVAVPGPGRIVELRLARMNDATTADGAHPPVAHLAALTSLRFFAAFAVLMFHYVRDLSDGRVGNALASVGYTGVTFFFVLSGFILAHNYKDVDFKQRTTVLRFYAARLSRVYPVLLVTLLLSVPFAIAQWLKMPPGTLKTLAASSALLAPLGLHAWVPGAACAINCPSWSISTEFFFYLLFPLMVLPIMRRPRLSLLVTLGAWALACGACLWLWEAFGDGSSIMFPHEATARELSAQAIKYFPIGRLPEFALGIVLYALWFTLPRQSTALLLAGFFLAGAAIVRFAPALPEIVLHNGLTAVAWAPLILAAAGMRGGPLCAAPLVYLGRISFALYLVHFPVMTFVKAVDKRLPESVLSLHPGLAIAAVTALAIGAAALVHHLVEEPSRKPMMRRLAGLWRLSETDNRKRRGIDG